MATVELRFSPLPAHVRTARMIAAAVGRRSGVPEYLIDEVKLAVSEACARAVGLHQRTGRADLVTVNLVDDIDLFTIEVTDHGPVGEDLPPREGGESANPITLVDAAAADDPPTDDPPADADPLAPMPPGLGLAILEGLVDDVRIEPAPKGDGTVVSMSWALPEPDKREIA